MSSSAADSVNTADKNASIPKTSVRRLMKISDEVSNISQEAVGLVGKATEEFIGMVSIK